MRRSPWDVAEVSLYKQSMSVTSLPVSLEIVKALTFDPDHILLPIINCTSSVASRSLTATMAQPVQYPPPSWKFYPIIYVTNGQEFPGTDLAKPGTTEWMTDGFIERGIRAVAHMPNNEEGMALTVSTAWNWPGSKTQSRSGQLIASSPSCRYILHLPPSLLRLTATDHAGMALIVRGSGWHFTPDVRFFGEITRNYLVDSLLPPVTSSRPVVEDKRAENGESKDKRAKAETLEQGQIRLCREGIPAGKFWLGLVHHR
jgi:hypothetical protein